MKATLLTEEEIYGKNKLDIIKKYGIRVRVTDFAIATGVFVPNFEEKTGWFYLKTPYYGNVRAISFEGNERWNLINGRDVGVLPVLEFLSINEIFDLGKEVTKDKLKLGYYADNALLDDEQRMWNDALNNTNLRKCGQYYIRFCKL